MIFLKILTSLLEVTIYLHYIKENLKTESWSLLDMIDLMLEKITHSRVPRVK